MQADRLVGSGQRFAAPAEVTQVAGHDAERVCQSPPRRRLRFTTQQIDRFGRCRQRLLPLPEIAGGAAETKQSQCEVAGRRRLRVTLAQSPVNGDGFNGRRERILEAADIAQP